MKKGCRIKACHHYIWQTLFANVCHIVVTPSNATALTSMQDAAIRMFHRRHVQFLQRELNDAESSVDAKEQNSLPSEKLTFSESRYREQQHDQQHDRQLKGE